ncbi:hypothetical protein ISS37_06040 [candidate division KSB1 bacterium]|nr:hypothetical protein [candidate division KSB1 bacterium]
MFYVSGWGYALSAMAYGEKKPVDLRDAPECQANPGDQIPVDQPKAPEKEKPNEAKKEHTVYKRVIEPILIITLIGVTVYLIYSQRSR